MRQLLKNVKIYDGTGSEPFQGDILLEEDRIAKIAAEIDLPADSVFDLKGKSVSSGFIDGHSHNDWFAIKKEPLPYFKPFLLQGITTFIAGNCGISFRHLIFHSQSLHSASSVPNSMNRRYHSFFLSLINVRLSVKSSKVITWSLPMGLMLISLLLRTVRIRLFQLIL